MTTREELKSPAQTKLFSTGQIRPKVVADEVLESLNQKPVPTVWKLNEGRPILDRLPSVEEQYQKGYEADQAYVYLDPKRKVYNGEGSMEPVVSPLDPALLTVQTGIATSRFGQVKTPYSEFNVATYSRYGLQNGKFQVGFKLTEEPEEFDSPIPGYALVSVENSPLGDAALIVGGENEIQYHEAYYAVSNAVPGSSWWPSLNQYSGPYCEGSWLTLDFRAPVTPQQFVLVGDPTKEIDADVVAFHSDDGIVWTKAAQTLPMHGKWTIDIVATEHRYWRFYFWDGRVSVSDIEYTGTAYFPDLRTKVKYPRAEFYVDNLYEESPDDFLLVAVITVKDLKITRVTDYRTFTSRKYEPVANWLTKFQDVGLKHTFDSVERYYTDYMNPVTADYHFYEELDDSEWFGLGEFDLGDTELTLDLPVEVMFTEDILPTAVICVKQPSVNSDLVTKIYTDELLYSISIDNGIYN